MTTAPNPDEAEQRLQRLLALKRHEAPPPGFFDRLPHRIMINLRAGIEMQERPWYDNLWHTIVREPIVAGSYAALGLGALVFGVSVFDVAVDANSPAVVGMEGMVTSSSALPMVESGYVVPGVIYRFTPAPLSPASAGSGPGDSVALRIPPQFRYEQPGSSAPPNDAFSLQRWHRVGRSPEVVPAAYSNDRQK